MQINDTVLEPLYRPNVNDAAWAYGTLALMEMHRLGMSSEEMFDAVMVGRANPAFERQQGACTGSVLAPAADTMAALTHLVLLLQRGEHFAGVCGAEIPVACS